MTATQRHHVFNLIVVALVFAMFLIALPFVGAARAAALLGFMGFLGFGLLFYWRGGKPAVVCDERDRDIQRRAMNIAFATFWTLFVLGCVGTWLALGQNGAIPIRFLPIIMYAAWGIWQAAQSIAVLVQYHRSV